MRHRSRFDRLLLNRGAGSELAPRDGPTRLLRLVLRHVCCRSHIPVIPVDTLVVAARLGLLWGLLRFLRRLLLVRLLLLGRLGRFGGGWHRPVGCERRKLAVGHGVLGNHLLKLALAPRLKPSQAGREVVCRAGPVGREGVGLKRLCASARPSLHFERLWPRFQPQRVQQRPASPGRGAHLTQRRGGRRPR